ncbi:MAG TPA: fibronectin type III domain-containing protein, partial [Thermomicrobiaceae bacterium]|nr:fibronectin type III domain-containing protein [Thermomicrobiaceae bacterium]
MGRRGLLRVATVVALLVGLIAPLVPAFPARAYGGGGGQILTDYTTYGANATIYASGVIDYVTNCPPGGTNTFITPTADVYLLRGNPTVTDGEGLAGISVGGQPTDTIVSFDGAGDFLDEIIGFSLPSGALGAGSYEIVLDECRDGIFHSAIDEAFPGSFTVRLPTVVPPVDPSILAIKADAEEQAANWGGAGTNFERIMQTEKALELARGASELLIALGSGEPVEVFDAGASWAIETAYAQGEEALTGRVEEGARTLMEAEAAHYEALHADPPDPNYQQVTPLPPQQALSPGSTDPLVIAAANLGTAAGSETAVSQAFLNALQRYEGASNAGDGGWALIHAREMQQYATLLANDLTNTSSALNAAAAAVTGYSVNLDTVAADLELLRSAVQTNGFTAAQQQALVNAGFTAGQISQLQTTLSGESFAVTEAQTASALQAIATADATQASDLRTFASNTQTAITTLAADPSVFNDAPVASAGGPYTGTAGTPVTLDASGSTTGAGTSSIVSYHWDTQGSGTFTTSGATVSVTYDGAFQGMVGVMVTNADGLSSVAYAPISITGTIQPPSITASTPPLQLPLPLSVGQAQAFSVTTQDAANDPVSVQWTVDGTAIGSGAAITYTPQAADAGARVVQAVATDTTDPAAGSSSQRWLVGVCPAPAVPGQPTNVGATPGDGQVLVTWSPPAESCGNVVTGYAIVASTGQSAALPGTAAGVHFLGLPNGTPVSFTVTALNAIGAGQPSNPSPTVTPTGAPPPPGGPLTLTTIASGFPSPIGIDWYEPANEVIMSVNYGGGGQPNNFDLVDSTGTFTPFSPVKGLGDEVYMVAIR